MRELLAEIERVLPDGGAWCKPDKAHTLASIIVGLRPQLVVEIGVWMGGSLIPMLLALGHVRQGRAIAIDPWAKGASVVGQDGENAQWWGAVDHEAAYRKFLARLELHELTSLCTVRRVPADQCEPDECQLLHIDGNHGPQAVRDVERFAPHVTPGGILVLDDLDWAGGHVSQARTRAGELGFIELYPLGTGIVMQRQYEEGF